MAHPFPFAAIVGQDEMKRSLLIAATDPGVGGVLVFGDRGTGKSTAVRALAALLPPMKVVEGCRFGCDPAAPVGLCEACRGRSGRLLAREVPPYGGDTLFANQYLAWEQLSDGMKAMISNLKAVHSDIRVAGPQAGLNAQRSSRVREDANWRPTESVHPVVRTHPETGRKCLFVNHSYVCRFDGMTDRESRPLLDFLMEHGHRPEFTCRFRWQPGSIAFWDNRCTKHLAIHDAGPFHRRMQRTQIAGDAVV